MLLKYVKPVLLTVLAVSAAVAHAQTVIGTITLPNFPEQVAVNALTNQVFVAVPNFGAQPFDYLTVIDGKSSKILKNIKIPPVAYAVATDLLNGLVYVGGTYVDDNGISQSQVVAIDPRTYKVLATISISDNPGNGIQGLAVNSLNGDVYVANSSDSEIDVIHCFKLKDRITTNGAPYGVTVNPLINTVYAALLNGGVAVISGKTNQITTTAAFGTSDAGIVADLGTGNVLTTNSVGSPDTGSVGILNKTGELEATVPAGNFPLGIDVDYFTHLAFVANIGDNTISVINDKTNAVTATVPVSALFLAVNPVTRRVYVAPAINSMTLTVLSEK
jgi:YVTN family beta-propeller protein